MIANPVILPLSDYKAQHVRLAVDGKVATLTLNRPDKKNPLTFESYAEIANIFRAAAKDKTVKAFVITGEGGNFCSGGDVFEIIGPLVEMNTVELLEFTRMTGEAVKAMRQCPQPIVAAIDGVCAGAGAILAMASDMRFGTAKAKVAFLFNRVGLAGCDMGACAILPRIIGQGRASELLYTGRAMSGEEAERWGFFNRLVTPETVLGEATKLARELADGPDICQRHDQAHARNGMGHVGRAGDRGRGCRASAVHGNRRLSRAHFGRSPRSRSRCSRATDVARRNPHAGRSSRSITAASPASSRAGPTPPCPACRMTTWTRPAARALRHSARRDFSRPACRPNTAGCIRSSTCARSALRARSWHSATGSRTLRSPCRGSAPARSRSTARRS